MEHRKILCLFLLIFSYPVLADLNSKLFEASFERDIDQVNKLINDGANVNARTEKNLTPIMQAILADDWQDPFPVIQALINAGADVNARDSQGRTALMWVITKEAQSNLFPVITTLLKNGAEINLRDNQKDTALMIALNHGRHEFVKLLLENNAYPYLKNANGYDAYALADANRVTHRHDINFNLARKALLLSGDAYVNVSEENLNDSTFQFISNAAFLARKWTVISSQQGIVIGRIIRKRRTYEAKIVHKGDYVIIAWLPKFKKNRTNYLHNLRVDFVKILKINKLKLDMDSTNKN